MSDTKPKPWHAPTNAEIAASLEWSMKFERDAYEIKDRVCGHCGAKYSLQPDTFNHLACPECGALGQGLPPEMEDRVYNQPTPPAGTQEQSQQYMEMKESWWQRVNAKRHQLQRYFTSYAARGPRTDALKNLMLQTLEVLGRDASAKAVLEKMQQIDGGKVIQEVTEDGAILWRNPQTRHEKKTRWPIFQNRLSHLRKAIRGP